jgi:hypothetical protein
LKSERRASLKRKASLKLHSFSQSLGIYSNFIAMRTLRERRASLKREREESTLEEREETKLEEESKLEVAFFFTIIRYLLQFYCDANIFS